MSLLALAGTALSLADTYGSNPNNKLDTPASLFNEALSKIKNAGKDVVTSYMTGVANSLTNTSTGISQAAQGVTVKSDLLTWLIDHWIVIIALIGLFLLLKGKR